MNDYANKRWLRARPVVGEVVAWVFFVCAMFALMIVH